MMNEPSITYTRDQIKEAIRAELTRSDFMGEEKERYYTVVGIVMEALDKIDKKQSNEITAKSV